MEFHVSYFKSWKMMLWKCCPQYASKFEKLSSGHRTGKGQFSFQSILVHWFLECRHSLLPSLVWPLPICLDSWTWQSRFLCNIPFTASDLASITSHIHSWVLFLLWLHPFILSGVISPLICSSMLGIYQSGEFLFQYPIILPFHIVHGVLKARILKLFGIPFSSGTHSVRPLHHDPLVPGGLTGMA